METVEFWSLLQRNQRVATYLLSVLLTLCQGIDFPHIDIACVAGLQASLVDLIQMYGRIVRSPETKGLAILFHEMWVQDIALEEYGEVDDLDRPINKLRPNSSNRERAGYASVKLVKKQTCTRRFFAEYLNDTADAGAKHCIPSILASLISHQHSTSLLTTAATNMVMDLIFRRYYQDLFFRNQILQWSS